MTVRGLLSAMERLNLTDRFLIIGRYTRINNINVASYVAPILIIELFSDGWADRADVVADYERQALGSISIRIHSAYVDTFDPYYFALNPFTNKRNPWFKEFWEMRFGCKMPMRFGPEKDDDQHIVQGVEMKNICTGEYIYIWNVCFKPFFIKYKTRNPSTFHLQRENNNFEN